MRSMYDPGHLLLVSKKPRIKKLVEDSRTMSEEQILALSEKPDVIKGLLLINKFGIDQKKALLSEKLADAMQDANQEKIVSNINTLFPIYQYTASDSVWITTGIHDSEVLLDPGNYFVLDQNKNQIIFKSNYSNISMVQLVTLLKNCTFIKYGTIKDTYDLDRDRVSKLL